MSDGAKLSSLELRWCKYLSHQSLIHPYALFVLFYMHFHSVDIVLTRGPTDFKVLTCTHFIKHLRYCLRSIGLDTSVYTGHSFRRGGASLAYQAGLPVEAIKLLRD